MAGVASNTVWEIRPGAGNDNNGGGFVPGSSGTDYSQQNSPQYNLTGLTSSGSGNTLLYSGASADMVGNVAQTISGSNVASGMFQITSVSVGVSITFSTNNQNTSIATGAASGVAINIGGALASLGILYRVLASFTQVTDNNTIYIKATDSLTVTSTGQNYDVNNVTVIGYGTTRGDGIRPIITTSTNSVIIHQYQNSGFSALWMNINFTNTAGTNAACFDANGNNLQGLVFNNCVFNGFTYGLTIPSNILYHCIFFFCEFTGCTSAGVLANYAQYLEFSACYIHGNAIGIETSPNGNSTYGSNLVFNRCTIYNNTTYGVIQNAGGAGDSGPGTSLSFWNCNIVNNGSDGINNVGNNSAGKPLWIFNCIIIGNGGFGINCGSTINNNGLAAVQTGGWNAYFNNTSGNQNNFPSFSTDVTLSGVPFTNIPTDWTLNSNSGEGASCKGIGTPSSIP